MFFGNPKDTVLKKQRRIKVHRTGNRYASCFFLQNGWMYVQIWQALKNRTRPTRSSLHVVDDRYASKHRLNIEAFFFSSFFVENQKEQSVR